MQASATGRLQVGTDYIVGAWHVRPSLNAISAGDQTIQLEPKVMDLLVMLIEGFGRVVSRDELHERLWPDSVVTDKALTRLVSELRKALGDDPRDPRIVATISKGGYRLVTSVSVVSPGDGSIEVLDPRGTAAASSASGPVSAASSHPRMSQRWMRIGVVVLVLAAVATFVLFMPAAESEYVPAIQLTAFAGYEISPALSPQGDEVAFSWQGASGDNWDIYVKQPGSDGLLRLTDRPSDDLHPTWSPDGTRIAFLRFDDAACSINWVPALSGQVRRIGPCEWIDPTDRPFRTSSIDWSPDGLSIAAADSIGLVLVDVETGQVRDISKKPVASIADVNPAFSPDGGSIAFSRIVHPAIADLYVVRLDDASQTRLTNESRLILGHDWTPDGRHILYSSNRSGRFGLWRVPHSGGPAASIPADGWNIEKVTSALERNRIAYEAWIYDTNIWRMSLSGDSSEPPAAQRLIQSTLWDRHPAVSPDGSRIGFVSNRAGSWEVWTADTDGSDQIQLTQFGSGVVGAPQWSPDGDRIAVHVQREAGSRIHIIDLRSGMASPLSAPDGSDAVPVWSIDGSTIFFGSKRTGSWQIWSMRFAAGPDSTLREEFGPMQITNEGGYAVQPLPDGSGLLYTHPDSAGIWRIGFDGGAPRRLYDHPTAIDWGNWKVTDDGILVLERGARDEPARLRRLHFDGTPVGEPVILDRAPTPYHPGFAVEPGGRSILLTLVDAADSDLFVMELR